MNTPLMIYKLFLQLYGLGIRLVSPWNPKARLWLEGRKKFPVFSYTQKTIWMHCSSLGEFEQGRPVLEAVRKQYPGYPCILSFFSPSGYEIRKNYPGADQVIYLPVDSARNARDLTDRINPALVLWVKYEFWHYYLKELKDRNVPILLLSARFRPGQPFFSSYGRFWRNMLQAFHQLFVQDERSVSLLSEIGLGEKTRLAGDTRFDRVSAIAADASPLPLLESFKTGYRLVVAGSTWQEDEEELIHYARKRKDLRLVIAPHEVSPDRIREIKKEFDNACLYSQIQENGLIPDTARVLIIDNIGMLSKLYRYADLCYIGGGFGNGIHNVLEAAVYGKPVFFGPEYGKFQEAIDLVEKGAAFPVKQALDLEEKMDALLADENACKKAGDIAGKYVQDKKGATQTIMNYIAENRLLTN